MKTVYLAGPIINHTKGDANDWRLLVSRELAQHNIRGISPLRCEPPPDGKRYSATYPDARFGTARAIASKNVFDVRACDMMFVYLPHALTSKNPAYGSTAELAWGHIIGKPTIVVSDDPYIREHPLINACAGWMLSTLDEGIEVVVGVLHDYANGVERYEDMYSTLAAARSAMVAA